MYISPETEKSVIRELRRQWRGSNKNLQYFFVFLLLKRLGISVKTPVIKSAFRRGSPEHDIIVKTLEMLTSLVSPDEHPLKRCSLDPLAFWTVEDEARNILYYNPGTDFDRLPGRIGDTIDNTLRDYFVERGQDRNGEYSYTLRQDYLDILSSSDFLAGNRINVFLLAVWIYRFYDFQTNGELSGPLMFLYYLRDMLITDFRITDLERQKLFTERRIDIALSADYISSEEIKECLPGIDPQIQGQQTGLIPRIERHHFERRAYEEKRNIMNENDVYELMRRKKQVILYGPPGTGKSYLARKVSELERSGERIFNEEDVLVIQFHPSYRYEDFIGGVRWDPETEKPVLEEGLFLQLCKKADQDEDQEFLLVIDEINRGNVSSIFGETILTLEREYRVVQKDRMGIRGDEFYIPINVCILGTMNSADRSLALIDYALRRRFTFVRFDYSPEILEVYYSDKDGTPDITRGTDSFSVIEFATTLNKRITKVLNRDMTLGQSYFMSGRGKWRLDEFREVFNYILLPMLEEYTFGKEGKLEEILSGLNARFTDDSEFFQSVLEYLRG